MSRHIGSLTEEYTTKQSFARQVESLSVEGIFIECHFARFKVKKSQAQVVSSIHRERPLALPPSAP